MTITFLAPDGVAVTAQQFRQAQAAQYGGGSGRRLGLRSGFRVDTPSTVLTATSTTWTLGPCAAMIDPGATTYQGGYGWATDANVTGSVTAADATYARKDIVYIQVNDSSAGDGSGALSAPVLYLAGTASASPVAPTLPARSFLVGTISVPVAGGGSPTVTLNPAKYAAAGAPLPVKDQAARDALVTHDGLTVQRMDIPGRPFEMWDATLAVWFGSATPTTGAGWTLTGSLHRRGGSAGTQVAAAFKAIYGGGTFTVSNTSWIQAFTLTNTGYLPVANDAYGYFMLRAVTTRNIKADCAFTIDSTGAVYVRTLLGQASTTCAAGDELSFNTVWNA